MDELLVLAVNCHRVSHWTKMPHELSDEKKKKKKICFTLLQNFTAPLFYHKMEMRCSHRDSSAKIPYSKHYAEAAPALIADRKWPRKRECSSHYFYSAKTLPTSLQWWGLRVPSSGTAIQIPTPLYYVQTWPAQCHTIVCVCAFHSMVHDLMSCIFHTVKPEPNERSPFCLTGRQSETLTHCWWSVHLKWVDH